MFGISVPQLIILLVIIILIFGTKKLKNLGTDLGSSVKGFKKAMKESSEGEKEEEKEENPSAVNRTISQDDVTETSETTEAPVKDAEFEKQKTSE